MTDIDETLKEMREKINVTKEELSKIEFEFEETIKRHFYSSMWRQLKKEEIISFVKKPYVIQSAGEEWRLLVPKFIPLEVGWLEYQNESYNIYRVNRFVNWITPLPDVLKEELSMEKPKFDLSFDYEKSVLNVEKGDLKEIKKKYGSFIYKQLNHSIFQIKSPQRFNFLLQLLKDGIIPYRPKAVNPEDLNEKEAFELRDYQRQAYDMFLKYSHIGIFYPFGAGKSFLGIYIMAKIKGNKLIVVPTKTLIELWKQRIEKYCPEEKENTEIITYQSLHRARQRKYSLIIADELHHAPANTYSQIFFIDRKYTLGLTGSPFREDGRTELIFSFGYPIGADWNYFFKKGIVKKPKVKVILVEKHEDKIYELSNLLSEKSLTLIYCDSIRKGKEIANRFNTHFVYSETRHRLDFIDKTLEEKGFVVLSRVGDEGISLPEIQRIIEFDFLFGSRRQEAQRVGRLFHSIQEGEHIIIMTYDEFENYKKRLYALMEKGIELEWVRR